MVDVPLEVWRGILLWVENTGLIDWLLRLKKPRRISEFGTRNYRYLMSMLEKLLETGFVGEIFSQKGRWFYLTDIGCAFMILIGFDDDIVCGDEALKWIRNMEENTSTL